MNVSEWIVALIVAGALVYLGYYYFGKKSKKSCCGKKCSLERKPEPREI